MSQHHDKIKNDPRWKLARADCLDRDGHACVQCGGTEDLQADHIVRLVDGGEPFELSNLQTLCWTCHIEKEREYDAAKLIRTTWVNPNYPELEQHLGIERELVEESEAPVF